MRILFVALAVLSAIGISGCSSASSVNQMVATDASEKSASYQTMSVDELADVMADTNSAFIVVNVHIPYQGEIEGTNYNIAYNDIDALTMTLPEKDAPVILYCRSGNMSEQAARDLVELGYTRIYDVPGGMNAWQSSGHTLINNE